MSKAKFFFSIGLFIVLSIIGGWWSIHSNKIPRDQIRVVSDLPIPLILLLLMFPLLIYAADVLRFLLFSKAFGHQVGIRTAIRAVIANLFFSWVTPGAVMGAPAGMYVLNRDGLSWDTAFTISFGKSYTGLALLLSVALALVISGFGPKLNPIYLIPIITVVSAIYGVMIVLPLGFTFFPHFFSNIFEQIETRLKLKLTFLKKIVERLKFIRSAKPSLLFLMLGSHLAYFLFFIGPGAVLCSYYGGELISGTLYSIVYIAFSFIMPTPGGAGLTEATSVPFWSDLLPPSDALRLVLNFRFFTIYFQIFFGFVFLGLNRDLWEFVGGNHSEKK